MIFPLIAGLLAAVVVSVTAWAQVRFEFLSWPIWLAGVAALAMVAQRFVLDRHAGNRNYDGLADLLIHVHTPAGQDTGLRWAIRGVISMALSLCGGVAGAEGAATELPHALALSVRPRTVRWFEQRRRTDAAVSLAAGVAAAFGTPFAAVILPMELGLGGSGVSVAVASLSAFFGVKALSAWTGVATPAFPALHELGWESAAQAAVVGVVCGLVAVVLVRFFRYAQDSLLDLFQTQAWMRALCAGILLFLAVVSYRAAHVPGSMLLERVLLGTMGPEQLALTFGVGALGLSVVLAGFGTVGVLWPLLSLGGVVGFAVGHSISSGLVGAAALLGAVLGAPVAAAAMIYELTHSATLLMAALLASLLATAIRMRLKTRSLVQNDLEARELELVDGRSAAVLQSISVRDAMVTDHEVVHEQEPIAEVYPRLLQSRYPFLPVVNSQNLYTGLLTVDVVQDAWRAQSEHSNSPLSKLLEAKDLLYRSGIKAPTVRAADRLSTIGGIFHAVPCAPVLSEEGRVLGLLFIHNVRLAYDREATLKFSTLFPPLAK